MTSSENETGWTLWFRDHPATWVVLTTLGSLSYSAFSSSSVLTHARPVAADLDQESEGPSAEGRFRISGLELGNYLVAAEAMPSLTSGASSQAPIDKTLSSAALVEQFKGEKVFWRQFAIATGDRRPYGLERAPLAGGLAESRGQTRTRKRGVHFRWAG